MQEGLVRDTEVGVHRTHGGTSARPGEQGFWLAETLCVLLLTAILATLGAPALQAWATRLQLEAALDEWARGLALARSEAMATGRSVAFQPRQLPENLRWSGTRSTVSFGPSGSATPATLTLCTQTAGRGRSLVISRTGRVRAAEATCGFALVEVLVSLLLLAAGTLAIAQAQWSATHGAAEQLRQRARLDAASAGTESLRAIDGNEASWRSGTADAWHQAFAGAGAAATGMVLDSAPPVDASGWHIAAAQGAAAVRLAVLP